VTLDEFSFDLSPVHETFSLEADEKVPEKELYLLQSKKLMPTIV
jgi:hypothetical protein